MFRPEDPRSALSQALSPGDLCAGEGSESFPLADEIAFLDQRGFDRGLLAAATARALSLGVPAEDVLIREGHCPADRFYGELAAVLGLPFADQFTVGSMPAGLVLSRCEVAQVLPSAGFDYVVAPRGPQIANLFGPVGRALSGTLRIAVTTPARLTRAVVSARGEALASQAAAAPLGDAARWSARVRPTPGQKAALGLVASAVIALVILADDLAWLAAALLLATCFALQGGLRVLALLHGIRAVLASPPPPLSDHALPIYTILVPLYREASVLEALVKALGELDYPASKLDIKLLVEADDEETLRAALRMDLQPPFEVVVCPDGQPRTKPRALNIGLPLARDGLVVVYDAEDRPDRDQLRLAAAQFADNPAQVACLQAALAIDNADESWLTRLFATEYAQLFDVVLPGLARMGLPVPLGGTSNHFRVEALRTAGGWDAWNVTEDADLGLRLAQLGYRVGRLGSTTWEEAPVGLRPWVRQRTRWLKGWHRPVGMANSIMKTT